MEENGFSERIDLLVNELGFDSQKDFADKLGVSTAAITNWKKRGVLSTSSGPVMRIKVRFPQLNVKWIAFGEGNMYEDQKEIRDGVTYTSNKHTIDFEKLTEDVKRRQQEKDEQKKEEHLQVEMRPHYLALARAGLLSEEQQNDYEMQPVISQMPRYDFTARVWGDSMYPEYKSGDTIACLDVTKSSFIQWGRVHLINTRQGVMLKKIYDNGDKIKCISINSEEFPEYSIPKDEIFTVALVVGNLRIS